MKMDERYIITVCASRKDERFNIEEVLIQYSVMWAMAETRQQKSKKAKIKNHRKIAFESVKENVASVSKKGIIKAKKKGKTTVWVYAQNGICTKVKVVVK